MKLSPIIFAALLSLVFTTNSFSQCPDSTGHYSFALFGGDYIYRYPFYPVNDFVSAVTLEMEYRKSENWAFFASVMYQFVGNDLKKMYPSFNRNTFIADKSPATHLGMVNLGGRYYLSSGKLNTYLNFGISHQTEYIGDYSYWNIDFFWDTSRVSSKDYYLRYKFSLFAGAGLCYKVGKKINIEFQYNLFQNIEKSDGDFLGFTLAGGVRYVL